MRKEITFQPAYDKRDPDPKKNYGIHGVTMRWLYGDEKGVVQFVVHTNWHLPHIREDAKTQSKSTILVERYPFEFWQAPMPADLGYHSPTPQYEGQHSRECDVLEGKCCYYDGSGLNAERIFEVLIAGGSDGVWKELEQYYKELFDV